MKSAYNNLMNTSPPVCDYEGSDYRSRFWEGQGRDYEDQAERIAEVGGEMAAADPSAAGNPVQLSATQYSSLFKAAVQGNLQGISM